MTHKRATVTTFTTLLTNSAKLLTNSAKLLTNSAKLLTNSAKLLTNSAKLLTILAGSYRKTRGHVTYDTKARDLRYVGS